jgi:hypothetical protein
MRKRWCHDNETWTSDNQTTGNATCCGQMSHPSRCSLHQEEFAFGEQPRMPTIQNAWLHKWKT